MEADTEGIAWYDRAFEIMFMTTRMESLGHTLPCSKDRTALKHFVRPPVARGLHRGSQSAQLVYLRAASLEIQ